MKRMSCFCCNLKVGTILWGATIILVNITQEGLTIMFLVTKSLAKYYSAMNTRERLYYNALVCAIYIIISAFLIYGALWEMKVYVLGYLIAECLFSSVLAIFTAVDSLKNCLHLLTFIEPALKIYPWLSILSYYYILKKEDETQDEEY